MKKFKDVCPETCFWDRELWESFIEKYQTLSVEDRIKAARSYNKDYTMIAVLDKRLPGFGNEVMVEDKPYTKQRLKEGLSDGYEDFVFVSRNLSGLGLCFVPKGEPCVMHIESWGNTRPLIEAASWGGDINHRLLALAR
jgi:hypothetical protein